MVVCCVCCVVWLLLGCVISCCLCVVVCDCCVVNLLFDCCLMVFGLINSVVYAGVLRVFVFVT